MSSRKPPCKFYQQGSCRKGSSCPFPHVYEQRGGKNYVQTETERFSDSKSLDTREKELRDSLNSHRELQTQPLNSAFGFQWPAPVNLITGRDYSAEESRWDYYQAQSINQIPQYEQMIRSREQDMNLCINEVLKDSRKAARYSQIAAQQILNDPNTTIKPFIDRPLDLTGQSLPRSGSFGGSTGGAFGNLSFGSSSNSGNPFGSNNATSPFGTIAQNQGPSNFGASGFGSSPSSTGSSMFGSTGFVQNEASKSVFGSGGLGGASSSAFGQTTFGKTSLGQSKSAFGGASLGAGASSAFGSTGFGNSGFGQSSMTHSATTAGTVSAFGTSGFGQRASAASPFESLGTSTSTTSPFGQTTNRVSPLGQMANKPTTTAFGQSTTTATAASQFGQTTSGGSFFSQDSITGSAFGQTSNNASPFAQTSTRSAFGQGSVTFGSSPMGQPSQSSPFGQSAIGFGSGSVGFKTTNTGPFTPTLKQGANEPERIKEEDLSDFAKAQFKAVEFTLGQIPEVEPPLVYC